MHLEEFQAILTAQIEAIEQADLRSCVQEHLVDPRLEQRGWDYGDDGQTFQCWIGVEDRVSNTAIAYCEHGFGPEYPWGLLFLDGEPSSMGMDSGWFVSLGEAVRDSMFWDGENPTGYEVS